MANKLELTWFEKEKNINVEPRLLIEDSKLSHRNDSASLFNDANYDNMLIHGDNLLALKSLL